MQERLGHKSIKQTMDTYSHVLEVLHESAADLIENLVPSPRGSAEPAARTLMSEYKWSTNRGTQGGSSTQESL